MCCARKLCVVAERKLRLDPRLDCAQAQLLQPARLDLERERPCHVCVRIPSPERERRPELLRRLRRIGLDEIGGAGDGLLESNSVHVAGIGR